MDPGSQEIVDPFLRFVEISTGIIDPTSQFAVRSTEIINLHLINFFMLNDYLQTNDMIFFSLLIPKPFLFNCSHEKLSEPWLFKILSDLSQFVAGYTGIICTHGCQFVYFWGHPRCLANKAL